MDAQLGRDGAWQPYAVPVDWAPSARGIQLSTSPNLLSDFPKEPSLQNSSLCPAPEPSWCSQASDQPPVLGLFTGRKSLL